MNDKFNDKGNFSSSAVIKVIGVGGGGGNALNTMIESGLCGVEFIAANTDVQALQSNLAPIKIQLGRELTKGLGAGANPDMGRNAALEDKAILQEVLSGADMVFVTGGMGGGTGTGAAPIIAQVARELGALTVGVVTKPFTFEGKRRKQQSEIGIQALRQSVDTLITIPNQRLLSIAPPEMSMLEGFKLADEVLLNAVKGISDIINIPGRVNVDFADVKTIMSEMGMALMGIGSATGPNRAAEAARAAINSPLLEDIDIEGATGILINITGTSSMTLHEISEASTLIQEAAHEDANIIFGAVIDENMGECIRVTVIATGFDQARIAYPDQNITYQNIQNQNQFLNNISAQGNQPQQGNNFPHLNHQRNQQFIQPNFETRNTGNFNLTGNQQIPPSPFTRQNPPYIAKESTNQNYASGNSREGSVNPPQHSIGQNSASFRQNTPLSTNQNNLNHQPWNMSANLNPGNQQTGNVNFSQSNNPPFSQNQNSHNSQQGDEHKNYIDPHNGHQNKAAHQQAFPSGDPRLSGGTVQTKSEEYLDQSDPLKLAKELSDIEIDDTDFETPAYLRSSRKENQIKID